MRIAAKEHTGKSVEELAGSRSAGKMRGKTWVATSLKKAARRCALPELFQQLFRRCDRQGFGNGQGSRTFCRVS